jgi:antibiotic biosynthesis monooxygenase (ABM) superfamily enzyme
LIAEWPVFLRTLVATLILVPAMLYVLIPAMQRLFAGRLRPRPPS